MYYVYTYVVHAVCTVYICMYVCTVVCMYIARVLFHSHVHVYSYVVVVVVVVVVVHTHQVSPDHDLILDTHPAHPTIIFGTAFSGII